MKFLSSYAVLNFSRSGLSWKTDVKSKFVPHPYFNGVSLLPNQLEWGKKMEGSRGGSIFHLVGTFTYSKTCPFRCKYPVGHKLPCLSHE